MEPDPGVYELRAQSTGSTPTLARWMILCGCFYRHQVAFLLYGGNKGVVIAAALFSSVSSLYYLIKQCSTTKILLQYQVYCTKYNVVSWIGSWNSKNTLVRKLVEFKYLHSS